ncbi:hypothetical protein WA026_007655 [Henosepilachna vigintioctopunctata]|uniref:Uncharacterized protein n=1 Tax=Henosepilachna vigintioctopunctata TaxID=420089 RepID=A0AAW1U7J9_9CUCU
MSRSVDYFIYVVIFSIFLTYGISEVADDDMKKSHLVEKATKNISDTYNTVENGTQKIPANTTKIDIGNLPESPEKSSKTNRTRQYVSSSFYCK